MKKIISIILLISMLCGLGINVFAYSGAGTKANPYVITTPEDLMNMKNDLSAHYVLGNSIDMSGVWYEPIGNDIDGAFTGSFDGKGYTISNLDLDLEGSKYVGIFGYLDGTVKNVNLENVNANGYKYVGGIAGYLADNASITTCKVSGCVQGTILIGAVYTGGVAGYNSYGKIESSLNETEIVIVADVNYNRYSEAYAGGIVGSSYGEVTDCLNRNTIQTEGYWSERYLYAGGIAGSGTNLISNCINVASITNSSSYCDTMYIGGIIGSGSSAIVDRCENYGDIITTVRCENSRIGGIVGTLSKGNISRCVNAGKISSEAPATSSDTWAYSGGIVGSSYDFNINNCINTGYIYSYNPYSSGSLSTHTASSSGIVNRSSSGYDVSIYRCINSGKIDSSHNCAIISTETYRLDMDNCYNIGFTSKNANYEYFTESNYLLASTPHNNYYSQINNLIKYEQRSNEDSYNGFSFEDDWYIDTKYNSGFPLLSDMPDCLMLNESILLMKVNDTKKLKAYLNGNNQAVSWNSDNTDVVEISADGNVIAKQIGSCTVTATNSEGKKANCLVYVYSPATSIDIQSDVSVSIGSTVKMSYALYPETANETVYWVSSDEEVASVNQLGEIKGKKSGNATISVFTSNSDLVDVCEVTVTGKPVTSLSLSTTSTTLNVADTKKLSVTVSPTDYDGQITWSSSDENVATVDSTGLITAKYPGMAYIYAQAESGVTKQCTVTVKAPATEIKLNKSELTLQKGYTEKLLPVMMPEYTTDIISWASSNSSYVSVSTDGTVTAKAVGQVIVTATTTSGQKAYCTVNVVNPSVPVSSVTLDKTELIMTKADMAQLKAYVLPTNATNQNLTWSSSDESVASVNSTGVVTAVDTGVAIISATANNGVYHECVIKVISASGSSVVLSDAKASPNGTVQVKASLVKNPGISGYKFTVNYDDTILTPVAVTPNSEFGGSITTNLDDDNRVGLNIVWYANEDIDINGELFTIDFKVSDSAEYGDTSSVSIEYGAKDICNTAGEYFALYIDDATISIEEPIPGDIYEDGEVTIYDLTLLSRYITSLETFTERQKEAADVNNDDLVNVLDVIKMAQYLTGWSNIELMSVGLFSLRESAAPVISIGSASVNSANEAELPVYIKGNTGLAAYKFILDYNADDIEILSITPSELIIKENFNHNLGTESQAEDGLIVTSHTSGGNMTEDGVLFTIKVRYKNPTDTSVSPISIRDIFDNIGNEDCTYVTATYETGYALGRDYIVANKVVGDTNFSCELYFDDSYAEQSAKAIIAFYDGDGRMVQLKISDITVKPEKVDLSIDYDKKAYVTYKLMIWDGMGNLKPITEVK